MRSRTWFLLSLMLFVAAAFFWKLGEDRRGLKRSTSELLPAVQVQKQKSAVRDVPVPPALSSKKNLLSPAADSISTNATKAVAPYPHRLQNTSQTMEQLVRNDKAILLRNALIDTGAEGVKIPDELRSKGDPGSYIVQARGVVDVTFRAALSEAGAEIISYVPNNAYLVRLAGSADSLKGNKRVQSVLPYEPYYKLDTELLALVMEKKELGASKPLRVTLFPGQVDSAINALKGKASILDQDLKSSPFGPELILASTDLVALANLPQVQEIEPYYQREKMNDLTRVRVGVSTDTTTTNSFLNLGGSNIWVNVNDTAIDNSHPDLTGRVFPGPGVGITDTDGHGTHVAGIIASSGANGPSGGALTNVGSLPNANFRGKAPQTSIFSLDIFAGLTDAELQETAATHSYIDESLNSPLISNNSWGYGTANYNSSAASFDAAVRDALPGSIGSQPITYVFSAGNGGGGNNNGQGGIPGTVVSPATAKNVISVGAIENFRNITNEVVRPDGSCNDVTNAEFLGLTDSSDEVAFFSGRGNVGVSQEGTFGRLKPDLVAPGTWIASTRSQQFDEASYYSPLRFDGNFFPGLVLEPVDTNFFSIYIPDDPCGEGATLSLTINAFVTSPGSSNQLPLLIYTANTPFPSSSAGNFRGTNSVTFDRTTLPLNNILYYDIVNTNGVEISYNLQTRLVISNDFGTYFQVLSNLNAVVGPNYMFESGTSMSAPAISGMLALMQEFFEARQITNSPAMAKALLINSSRSVGSGYTYERERSINSQGWGLPNLQRILSTNADAATWPLQMFDQSTNATLATGEQHDRVIGISDTNSPLRITLVWTDPPGNPAVGVKLVNDLDLKVTTVVTNGLDTNGAPVVTTNVYVGNNFPGGEFTQGTELGTNGLGDLDLVRDTINNVENVYINGPLSGEVTVSVVGRRVNVNAVTGHTNGIVQDYALVIYSGDASSGGPLTVTTNVISPNTNSLVTVVTNGIPLLNQRVGANSPLQNVNANNLTDGTNTQWRFYVLNNPSNFTNIAFVTFLPPNLSGATNTVPGSRRIVEADIDLYVTTDPTLTNLNPAAILGADKSLKRGGQESVIYTNRSDSVFYVGIKSEDQRAAEFSFFAIASETPFSQDDGNGNLILTGVPAGGIDIPDGSPDNPGGVPYLLIATRPITVGRVIVTNSVTHERFGDLIETLTHNDISTVLLNHSFPDGMESGNHTAVFDDSGLLGTDAIPGTRPSDGPGSLNDFIGEEGVGVWIITAEDNALNATGRIEFVTIFLEKALETNDLAGGNGFTISSTSIPNGQSRGVNFVVPPNATNMIISISPKTGAIDTVVRQGRRLPTRTAPGTGYVDHGKIISAPGGNLIVGTTNAPPLRPGRYSLRLFNDSGSPVTVSGLVRFELDLAARSIETYIPDGPVTLLDDAVTNSTIYVDRDARVTSVEVGVRIDHPRVSDLVLHLVSPQGTRVLLAENRGGLSTNGYGISQLTTNTSSVDNTGGPNASTNPIPTTLNYGFVNVDYDFFEAPDSLRIYYDGVRIFDSGLVSNAGSISVPFGPGIDTEVIIIINEDGNPDPETQWIYTAEVLSGEVVHATFSENTNLALVPIKFAIPPFGTNLTVSNIVTFDSSYFESDPAGSYTTTVDGWTVTNSVDVVADSALSHRGTNFLSLGTGGISRTLPTVAGEIYNLKFAYRRVDPANLSSASIALDGIFTNQFTGNPNWVVHSMSFAAPANGTRLDIDNDLSGMLFDTFELTEGGDPNYFLPEESLKTLIGQQAQGDWKLEVWDNRAGGPLGLAQLQSWQLHLTFASTSATATTLTNGTTVSNTVSGSQIQYFIVDVPLFATRATNLLVSGGGPLNLLFNQDDLPVGSPTSGDYTLLAGTINGTSILSFNSIPELQPGRRYYLGVQNVNPLQTNSFTLTVTFDNTTNLVEVTPLFNGIPISTNLPITNSIQYFQYDLTNAVGSLQFQLTGIFGGDVDMVVRRNQLPTESNYDYSSVFGGTNDEMINISSPGPGRYYVGVFGFIPTGGIDYTIVATEGGTVVAPQPTLINPPRIVGGVFEVDANTVAGATYELQYSPDLVNWFPIAPPITATGPITTFTDPDPFSSGTARFYRVRVVP